MEDRQINAVFAEEAGAVKCGYCGKTLCFVEKKSKKSANNKIIIAIKCSRCAKKNVLNF